jgi:hypothetical protein
MLQYLFPNLFTADNDSKPLDLITTSAEKLQLLERETYHKTLNGDDVTEELKMMEFLLKSVKYQNQLKEKSEDSLSDILRFFWYLILVGTTCFSVGKFVLVPTKTHCLDNDSTSQYCQSVREKLDYFSGK